MSIQIYRKINIIIQDKQLTFRKTSSIPKSVGSNPARFGIFGSAPALSKLVTITRFPNSSRNIQSRISINILRIQQPTPISLIVLGIFICKLHNNFIHNHFRKQVHNRSNGWWCSNRRQTGFWCGWRQHMFNDGVEIVLAAIGTCFNGGNESNVVENCALSGVGDKKCSFSNETE
ncbi:hypothetical protein BC829DRAFT_35257 [Chytridium lagenaria]|nr:hypothetical protein BC829DRAFT_35257 [Chytridium lagenaria]